jgi:hypothetical protein
LDIFPKEEEVSVNNNIDALFLPQQIDKTFSLQQSVALSRQAITCLKT